MKIHNQAEAFAQIQKFWTDHPTGLLTIMGPTASGKTDISIQIAQQFDAEIISVDSRQVFRECDISSAKITTEEMQGVPHHGLDLYDLDYRPSVVEFREYAETKIQEIHARGKKAILCGGTMLWLDAITLNYEFGPKGGPKSDKKNTPKYPYLNIGIHWDRAKLYERINYRAQLQFEGGLIEETQKLVAKYGREFFSKSAWSSFGYDEILNYLDGESTYDEALEQNRKRNRNYAKRQSTWWRGRTDVFWVNLNKK